MYLHDLLFCRCCLFGYFMFISLGKPKSFSTTDWGQITEWKSLLLLLLINIHENSFRYYINSYLSITKQLQNINFTHPNQFQSFCYFVIILCSVLPRDWFSRDIFWLSYLMKSTVTCLWPRRTFKLEGICYDLTWRGVSSTYQKQATHE